MGTYFAELADAVHPHSRENMQFDTPLGENIKSEHELFAGGVTIAIGNILKKV